MRKITASKMNKKANLIATAMEQEAEEILLDAERAVKASCSVKDHAKALTRLESLLAAEGIEACFDKRVSRTAMKKTAEEDELLSRPEVETLVKNVVDAVVDEFEDSLKEVDKVFTNNDKDKQLLISHGIDKVDVLMPFYDDYSTCQYNPNSKNILFFGAMTHPLRISFFLILVKS